MLVPDGFSVKQSDDGGSLSLLLKHQQATAAKRDGSRDDCKLWSLTAAFFFNTCCVFPADDNISDADAH